MRQFRSVQLDTLMKREAFLVAFVVVTLVSGLSAGVRDNISDVWINGGLAVLVYGVLAFFTYQRHLFATWGLLAVLLLNGSNLMYSACVSLLTDPMHEFFLNTVKLLVGAYLTLGVPVIFRSRHRVV